jgi:cysteine sulfinate desulfinase/cysteine desulfurase-like protein
MTAEGAAESIRISFGRHTSLQELEEAVAILRSAVDRLVAIGAAT